MPDRYLGVQLGRYRTSRLLGAGSFSWVYEAADVETGTTVALKVLRPEYAGQPDAEHRFRREAETARRLHHPNIVAVRDVGQAEGAAYVVMDLLPLTLARRLELVHRLPEPDVIRIGLDVASALTIAHAAGIVHRDIKPDNILLGEQGEAVVADFGLARALQADPSVSASQQVMGTPHYFSPEQARGLRVDGRSDLYSLGITLFRAATGTLPYEGDDWYSVAKLHIEADVPSARERIPALTPEFDAVLQRLLAKKPEDRFASATMLIDALAQLPTAPDRPERRPGSGSAEATMIAPVPMSATFRRRRGIWMRRGAAGVLAASAALLLFFDQRSRSEGVTTAPRVDSTEFGGAVFGSDTVQPFDSLVVTPPFFGVGSPRQSGTIIRGDTNATRNDTSRQNRHARVVLRSDPAATLYVENRIVSAGAPVEVPANSAVLLRAAFPDASPDCRTAVRDTTVRLREGQQQTVELSVRPCGSVVFDIEPRNALVTLVSIADGTRLNVRADTAEALLLPAGRYALSATAEQFEPYTGDSLTITNSAQPQRRRIRLIQR